MKQFITFIIYAIVSMTIVANAQETIKVTNTITEIPVTQENDCINNLAMIFEDSTTLQWSHWLEGTPDSSITKFDELMIMVFDFETHGMELQFKDSILFAYVLHFYENDVLPTVRKAYSCNSDNSSVSWLSDDGTIGASWNNKGNSLIITIDPSAKID